VELEDQTFPLTFSNESGGSRFVIVISYRDDAWTFDACELNLLVGTCQTFSIRRFVWDRRYNLSIPHRCETKWTSLFAILQLWVTRSDFFFSLEKTVRVNVFSSQKVLSIWAWNRFSQTWENSLVSSFVRSLRRFFFDRSTVLKTLKINLDLESGKTTGWT